MKKLILISLLAIPLAMIIPMVIKSMVVTPLIICLVSAVAFGWIVYKKFKE